MGLGVMVLALSNLGYMREREILEKLGMASEKRWQRANSISDILVDMKQSSGRWTIAYVLKYLYQGETENLAKDMARLTLIGDNINPLAFKRFEVLSAIWPAISELGVVDGDIFTLLKGVRKVTQNFYEDPGI